MTTMFAEFLRQPPVERLGWTLLHFVWQGAAIAAVFGGALAVLRRRSANARYLAGCLAMLLMASSPVVTFLLLQRSQPPSPVLVRLTVRVAPTTPFVLSRNDSADLRLIPNAASQANPMEPQLAPPRPRVTLKSLVARLDSLVPWLVAGWFLSVLVLSVRLLGGWVRTQRMKRGGAPLSDPSWIQRLTDLARRIGVSRPVRLVESALTQVPTVIGWLRSVILLPASAMTGLSAGQLEAILAHELAHIRRHDYLVNLLQTLVETLLFYHPAVWWISRHVRQEREHCCDDVAVAICHDRIVYAHALTALEELRGVPSQLAMAARGGSLLARVRRLVGLADADVSRPTWWPTGMLMASVLAAVIVSACMRETQVGQRTSMEVSTTSGMKAQSRLHGVVVDEEGKGIRAARVILYYKVNEWDLGNRIVESTETDANGAFAFTRTLQFKNPNGTDSVDHYIVFATHPDYALAWKVIVGAQRDLSPRLTMTQPQTQAFRVTDQEGRPLPGARVWLRSAGESTDPNPVLREWFSVAEDLGLVGGVADAQGRVTLSNLPPVDCACYASLAGFADLWSEDFCPPTEERTINMTRAASVAGTIHTPSGNTVTDAIVLFSADWMWDHVLVKTDQNGRYHADGLVGKGGSWTKGGGTGGYKVGIRHTRFAAVETNITVDPGQVVTGFNIIAVPGTLVKGKVLTPQTKRPIPGARVEGLTTSGRVDTYANANGDFALCLAEGPAEFFFYHWSAPAGLHFANEDRPPTRKYITGKEMSVVVYAPAEPRPTYELRGRAVLDDGSPAVGVKVYADAACRTATNPDGTFELRNLVVGERLKVYFESQDRRWAGTAAYDVTAGQTELPDPVRLQATRMADVVIKDREGQLRTNMSIRVTAIIDGEDFWQEARVVKTDAAGQLKIDGILPGLRYGLRDEKSDRAAETLALIPLAATTYGGAQPCQDVMLTDTLVIRVVDPVGHPIPIKQVTQARVFIDGPERGPWVNEMPIERRLADESIVVKRESLLLAKPGQKIELLFLPQKGLPLNASGTYPENVSQPIVLTAEAPPEMPDIDEKTGPSDVRPDELAGRVVDPQGNPVEGATVSLQGCYPKRSPVATDAQGVFRFPGLGQSRFLYLQMETTRFATRWITDAPVGHGFTIRLDDSTRLKGQFTLTDGKPAGKTTITLICNKKTMRPTLDHLVWGLRLDRQTDDRGGYDFPLEPGLYEVQVSSESGFFARQTGFRVVAGKANGLPSQLEPGVRLRLQTVDSVTGKPVAGVRLVIWDELPYEIGWKKGTERVTYGQGIAEWESLLPGVTRFEVLNNNYKRCWSTNDLDHQRGDRNFFEDPPQIGQALGPLDLDLKRGMSPVVVEIERGVHVWGKVVGPNDQPVAKAEVDLNVAGIGVFSGDARYRITTDEAGRFNGYLPAGNGTIYNLSAHDPQSRWANAVGKPFNSKAGDELEFTLRLTAGGWISGRLVDPAGKAVHGVKIQVTSEDQLDNPYFNPKATTDDQGRFKLGPMRAGLYAIHHSLAKTVTRAGLKEPEKLQLSVTEGQTSDAGDLLYRGELQKTP